MKPIPIILAAFFAALTWAMLVPLWHFPDEQAHFAQVQNYAEIGTNPKGGLDLSFEIYESERILGTLRDVRGINNFTYHPEYRIQYSNSFLGEGEDFLKTLPQEARTTYVKQESPHYPPAFYWWSALGYRLSYLGNLFARVWAVRVMSVLLFAGIVAASWFFAGELFGKNRSLRLATTMAIAFHPMLMFVSAGINNDTLSNLVSVVILWLSLKLIHQGINFKTLLGLSLALTIGVLSKQLVFLFIPTIGIALVLALVKTKPVIKIWHLGVLILGLGLVGLLMLKRNDGFWLPYWPQAGSLTVNQWLELFRFKALQLYRETFVWYWGVFKWLGVTLPFSIIRIIKISIIISLIGWIKKLSTVIKESSQPRLGGAATKWFILLVANVVYIGMLLAWDLSLTSRQGFSHGIQGRYFFPLIASHMAFLVYGWYSLLPKKLSNYLPLAVLVAFVSLNLAALFRVLDNYYTFVPGSQFIREASQYKPIIAKWPYILVFPLAYTISVFVLLKFLWKEKTR